MDASEFKRQFLPLSGVLYRAALRMTGNAAAAEDLVQETYLRLWTRRDSIKGIADIRAYCLTLTRNLFISDLRKARPAESGRAVDELQLTDGGKAERQAEASDTAETIMRIIDTLPEAQRTVIRMKDVKGLPPEEIMRETGLSAVNMRVTLSRARTKVREIFMKNERRHDDEQKERHNK